MKQDKPGQLKKIPLYSEGIFLPGLGRLLEALKASLHQLTRTRCGSVHFQTEGEIMIFFFKKEKKLCQDKLLKKKLLR